jgi:hypothetical protein
MNDTSTFCSGVKRLPQTPDTTKRKLNIYACTVGVKKRYGLPKILGRLCNNFILSFSHQIKKTL